MAKMIEHMRNVRWEGDAAPAIVKLLKIRSTRIDLGEATMEFAAGPEHANPAGTLHGGILCDFADLAMGTAYFSTLEEGEAFTTLELSINFLKPIWSAELTAKAKVVKGGHTVGLVECDVTDEKGSLVARAKSTCLTLRGAMAKGR